ncbi:MAG: S9 family peptidase [Dehalococcoidia bacterium]|nr:S9 family peptidase [Dehalococcoidia bacterium]
MARNDIWIVPAQGGPARKLTQSRGPSDMARWSPDGQWVAYAGHAQGQDGSGRTSHIWVIPAEGGEAKAITETFDRSVATAPAVTGNAIAWLPDDSGLAFLALDRGNVDLMRVTLSDRQLTRLVDTERSITGFTLSSDGTKIGFIGVRPESPGEVHLRQGQQEVCLTSLNTDLFDEVRLLPAERINYRALDGLLIEGWIIKPGGFTVGQPIPAVLDIHGGPHGQYGNTFMPHAQALAGAGFLGLYTNPRGSTGYGEPFSRAVVQDLGRSRFRGPDGRCRRDRALEVGGPRANWGDRVQLRRVHDELGDNSNRPVPRRGERGMHQRSLESVWNK